MGITVLGAVFVDIKGFPTTAYIPGGRNVGNVVQVHGGVSRNIAEDIGNIQLRRKILGRHGVLRLKDIHDLIQSLRF